MRNLTEEEIKQALDDNGEREEGCIAIEATVQELSDLGTGTVCGHKNNQTFKHLASKGFHARKCRGWYHPTKNNVWGMFHIKIQTDKTANKVDKLAQEANGSLRFNGNSLWNGYKNFEIE